MTMFFIYLFTASNDFLNNFHHPPDKLSLHVLQIMNRFQKDFDIEEYLNLSDLFGLTSAWVYSLLWVRN